MELGHPDDHLMIDPMYRRWDLIAGSSKPVDLSHCDLIDCGLVIIKQFFTPQEIDAFVYQMNQIRQSKDFPAWTGKPECGRANATNYIHHSAGRRDLWNVLNDMRTPDVGHLFPNLIRWQRKSIGCLFLDAHENSYGKWHRDAGGLFKINGTDNIRNLAAEDNYNLTLPEYYYNMLTPLCDLNITNGSTEFLLYSHIPNNSNFKHVRLNTSVGDVILFNGKLLHRGTPNTTDSPRDMLYTIFTAPWYNESIL
jgi:hypothetical protein